MLLTEAINHAAEAWGIRCMRYEIRDIQLPTKVREAMQMQVCVCMPCASACTVVYLYILHVCIVSLHAFVHRWKQNVKREPIFLNQKVHLFHFY